MTLGSVTTLLPVGLRSFTGTSGHTHLSDVFFKKKQLTIFTLHQFHFCPVTESVSDVNALSCSVLKVHRDFYSFIDSSQGGKKVESQQRGCCDSWTHSFIFCGNPVTSHRIAKNGV